jgi:hypothetical protein
MIKDILGLFALLAIIATSMFWVYIKLTETGEYPEIRRKTESIR